MMAFVDCGCVFHGEVKFLFQLADKAHADAAKGSDGVGKGVNVDAHGLYFLFIMLIEHGYDIGCR
jgi:hypothetical protein